jgi:EpsI family protein
MTRKNPTLVAAALAVAMAGTAAAAHFAKPTRFLADTRANLKITPLIPAEFGNWKQLAISGGVVNPQQQAYIDSLYSELINRTYVNDKGDRVMLSIAYGKNQSDSFQVHRPEICYPAQGFQLKSNVPAQLMTEFGGIPVRRIETLYGNQRPEPVTYWTTLGDQAVISGTDKKIKEIRYAMRGYIADGLLFRVSTIDPDSGHAFSVQDSFTRDLLKSLSPELRQRLAGLAS